MSAAVTLSARQDGDASGQEGEREYWGLLPKRGRILLLGFSQRRGTVPFLGPQARGAYNLLFYHWGFYLSPVLEHIRVHPF